MRRDERAGVRAVGVALGGAVAWFVALRACPAVGRGSAASGGKLGLTGHALWVVGVVATVVCGEKVSTVAYGAGR